MLSINHITKHKFFKGAEKSVIGADTPSLEESQPKNIVPVKFQKKVETVEFLSRISYSVARSKKDKRVGVPEKSHISLDRVVSGTSRITVKSLEQKRFRQRVDFLRVVKPEYRYRSNKRANPPKWIYSPKYLPLNSFPYKPEAGIEATRYADLATLTWYDKKIGPQTDSALVLFYIVMAMVALLTANSDLFRERVIGNLLRNVGNTFADIAKPETPEQFALRLDEFTYSFKSFKAVGDKFGKMTIEDILSGEADQQIQFSLTESSAIKEVLATLLLMSEDDLRKLLEGKGDVKFPSPTKVEDMMKNIDGHNFSAKYIELLEKAGYIDPQKEKAISHRLNVIKEKYRN